MKMSSFTSENMEFLNKSQHLNNSQHSITRNENKNSQILK